MNIYTGEVTEVPRGQAAPHNTVALDPREVKGWRGCTGRERLRRWKQAHADDPCRSCGVLLRRHSMREFQTCYGE